MKKGCLIGGLVAAAVLLLLAIAAVIFGVVYYVGKSKQTAATPPGVEQGTTAPTTDPAARNRGSGKNQDLPDLAAAKLMATNTLLNFKNAVNSGNFEPFYRTQLSDLWKRETSPVELKKTFQTFVDRKVDLSPIFLPGAQKAMVVEPAPYMDKDNFLVVKGYCPLPADNVSVVYELSYSREAKWGLSGINVKIKSLSP